MSYEVEKKYPIEDANLAIESVRELGGAFGPSEQQLDTYYSHPARDFAETDEALRIRQVGGKGLITYKGPKIDATSKTRHEIEIELCGGVAGAHEHAALLEALGFRPVAKVAKHRRTATIDWQDHEVEIALDEVESLGTFLELETAADDEGLAAARRCLASLAERLHLDRDERRSYLELLLAE